MPYEIIPHAADLRIKATGETKEEVFSETLRGLFESSGPEFDSHPVVFRKPVVCHKDQGRPPGGEKFKSVCGETEKVVREIKIKSANLNNMLVEFLNEALYFSDEERVAYVAAEFQKLTDTELKAVIFGQKIKKFHKPVKSASYHGTIIKEKDGEWEAVARFEI